MSIKPQKAYHNKEFLNSPEARAIRVQCELEETEKTLSRAGGDQYHRVFRFRPLPFS